VRRIALGLFIAASLADVAHAQAPACTGDADTLFNQGREASKEGKYADACRLFQCSYDLDHASGTELNLGDCHEQQGHLRKAWELFNSAGDDFERAGNPARAKFARDRASAVATRLATIIVHVAQPQVHGLAITIGGRVVQPAAVITDVSDPGPIEVTASAPDLVGFTTTKQVAGGGTITIEIPALAESTTTPVTVGPPAHVRRHGRVQLAWGLAGVSGASAIAGIAFTLVGRSHYNDVADDPSLCTHVSGGISCNDTGKQKIADAQRLADIGSGCAVAFGAFAAAAAVVYLTAPRDAVVVTPTASAQSAGLIVTGRF